MDPSSLSDSVYITAADVFVGDRERQFERVSHGLLRALFAPGDSNPIAGTASLVRLGAERGFMKRIAATKFVLTSAARSLDRFPSSLAGQQPPSGLHLFDAANWQWQTLKINKNPNCKACQT